MSYATGQMQDPARSSRAVYIVIFASWTVVGVFFFTQGLVHKFALKDPSPWWHYLVTWMTAVYLSAALTPPVLAAGRRYRFTRKRWLSRLLLHSVFACAFAVVQICTHAFVLASFGMFPTVMKGFGVTFATLLVMGFHQNVMVYWTLLGAQFAFMYYLQYQQSEREALRLELHASELKTQLAGARLSALKMQLQPHFLFNTLNAIVVLVRQQRGREAEAMLGHLSDLLRYVLEDVDAQEVPLRRELDYLRLYLDIERVRFQDRLRVEVDVEPEALDAAVPQMALQPIVENAIKHGIGRISSAGFVRIAGRRSGDGLIVTVHNDGPGLAPGESSGRGIGLSNTRARLHQLYGERASITLEDTSPRGVLATITLPFRLASKSTDAEWIGWDATDYADRR
ncbi:MAG TPA: histidine kinase [Bryobacteraceae bacterium]|nr:histidine kinase [Bryobacteraceae bacterium]